MISTRGLLVSVTVHAFLAVWVVSAAPVAREVAEDAEAMAAVEVMLEVPPVPETEPSQASAPQNAMTVDPQPSVLEPHEPAVSSPSSSPPVVPVPVAAPVKAANAQPSPENRPAVEASQAPQEIISPAAQESIPAVTVATPDPQPKLRKPDPPHESRPEITVHKVREEQPKRQKSLKSSQRRVAMPKPVSKTAQATMRSASSRRAFFAVSGRKAIASGGSAVDPGYKSRVLAKLRAAKRSPKAGASGRVMLSFRVSKSGGLLSAHIARSGGHPMLDQATLAMVRAAAPFPAMPPSMSQTSMSFTVPVQYN